MDYLPLFFNLKAQHCLLVGGGEVALRKARLLNKVGAIIHLVGHDIIEELWWMAIDSGGSALVKDVDSLDIEGRVLVIAATDDTEINAYVASWAKELGVPVNVVDNAELSTVIFGSIVDRSPIVIGISSGGNAPVLARWLRARLEATIPAALGKLAGFMGRFRQAAKAQLVDIEQRRQFWEGVVDGVIAEKVMTGNEQEAEVLLQQKLQQKTATVGEVALIGAGPGDPDLLTFKALRLLQAADVVLYDRLVNPVIVEMARRDAKLIYVGKANREHTMPQESINDLLIQYASQGKRVVRLKGGDPFIFGRGGEEIEGLAECKIPFQVVPGITAASACACYAGIPLTHRDYAQSVRFVTGHLKDDSCDLPWHELVQKNQTVVFYMGLIGLSHICTKLIEYGRETSTPIALIAKGSMPEQEVITGTLADLPAQIAQRKVHAPTLIIVGEVVQLHQQLKWFAEAE